MAQRPGIFPTFFISGFECSTFLWKDKRRRNLIEETQHDRHAQEDYNIPALSLIRNLSSHRLDLRSLSFGCFLAIELIGQQPN
jgi:hypothetical protein